MSSLDGFKMEYEAVPSEKLMHRWAKKYKKKLLDKAYIKAYIRR